jgi:hypothetical protein
MRDEPLRVGDVGKMADADHRLIAGGNTPTVINSRATELRMVFICSNWSDYSM